MQFERQEGLRAIRRGCRSKDGNIAKNRRRVLQECYEIKLGLRGAPWTTCAANQTGSPLLGARSAASWARANDSWAHESSENVLAASMRARSKLYCAPWLDRNFKQPFSMSRSFTTGPAETSIYYLLDEKPAVVWAAPPQSSQNTRAKLLMEPLAHCSLCDTVCHECGSGEQYLLQQ